jgi:hypothetical protein
MPAVLCGACGHLNVKPLPNKLRAMVHRGQAARAAVSGLSRDKIRETLSLNNHGDERTLRK